MQDLESIHNLRTLMQRLSLLIAITTAVTIPAGYVAVSYKNLLDSMAFKAQLSANRLLQFIYVHGPTWQYSQERLRERTSFTVGLNDGVRQIVRQAQGRVVLTTGQIPPFPRLMVGADIKVHDELFGRVEIETSLLPVLLETALIALFALALGGGAYVAMHRLPLRALDSTLERLQRAYRDVESHATETTYAYEELQRQYRLVEETTQELMIARDEAQTADRAKSTFLATMSHELRTPLNAIIGFSEMMQREVFGALGNRRYGGYASDILDSGRHLLDIINNMLDLSKIEAGKLELHVESVDLGLLLESCCRLVRERIEQADVELGLTGHAPPLPLLRADPVKLKQIVLNLLSNAIKFTPPGGRITVSAAVRPGRAVTISIADTGIGMTQSEIEIALQPFQQVDNSHTRQYQGTGLGLPLAKALAEQHRGSLKVISQAGLGTRVTVTLPADHDVAIASHEGGDEQEIQPRAMNAP